MCVTVRLLREDLHALIDDCYSIEDTRERAECLKRIAKLIEQAAENAEP